MKVVKSLVVLMAILEVFPIVGWIILSGIAIHLLLAGLSGQMVDKVHMEEFQQIENIRRSMLKAILLKEMLVTEALLGLLSAFPLHNWLLRATIKLLLSSSMLFWITVTAGGACLLYQGFTRLQDDVKENDTDSEEEKEEEEEEEEKEESEVERASTTSEDEEEDDSGTDEDSSAWLTINDSEED